MNKFVVTVSLIVMCIGCDDSASGSQSTNVPDETEIGDSRDGTDNEGGANVPTSSADEPEDGLTTGDQVESEGPQGGNDETSSEVASDIETESEEPNEAVETTEEMGSQNEMPQVPTDLTSVTGETCADAFDLRDRSVLNEESLTYNLSGSYGEEDNYNPLRGNSGALPPSCSSVYDAIGREVVYALNLRPGETFRAWVQPPSEPRSTVGLYFIDDCDDGTILDTDESGACGNNEYGTPGNCQVFGACRSVYEWAYTYPLSVAGVPTQDRTMFLVVDEVAADFGANYVIDWTIEDTAGNPRVFD